MLVESHKIPWFQTTNQIMYIYIKICIYFRWYLVDVGGES